MNRESLFKIYREHRFRNPSLIIGWSQDAGHLGSRVIEYLTHKLGGSELAELDVSTFFSQWGVQIEDNVIQFPESKFIACENKDILLFRSDGPGQEWYKFLNTILDVAVLHCNVKEVFTVGGVISSVAHTGVRKTVGLVSHTELKTTLMEYIPDIDSLEYQTPPGSRPTLNSYLLWVAKRRNIHCINLWSEVPFYMAAIKDPRSSRNMLSILNSKLSLGITLHDIENEIREQDIQFDELKNRNPHVARFIEMLEKGIALSQEENESLAKDIMEFFG